VTDAFTKLLIEKGVITDTEFKQKLLEERAVYRRILNPIIIFTKLWNNGDQTALLE
jgi:hypothetical protein